MKYNEGKVMSNTSAYKTNEMLVYFYAQFELFCTPAINNFESISIISTRHHETMLHKTENLKFANLLSFQISRFLPTCFFVRPAHVHE